MAATLIEHGATTEDSTGNFSVAHPSLAQAGDLLLAIVAYAGTAAVAPPGDWSVIVNENSGNALETNATAIRSLMVAWKVCDASPPASYAFTRTGGSPLAAAIRAYRGTLKSAPFDAVTSNTNAANSTTHSTTSGITTTVAEDLIIGFASGRIGGPASSVACATDPTSFITESTNAINRVFVDDFSVFTLAFAANSKRVTAGATGIFSITTPESTRCAMALAAFKSELSVVVAPSPASAASSVVAPTVKRGSIVIEPVATAKVSVVAPTVLLGSLVASTAPASARGLAVDPVVGTSSVTISPAAASASGIVVDPLVKGELVVAPIAVSARGEASIDVVTETMGPLFSPQAPITGFWTPDAALV